MILCLLSEIAVEVGYGSVKKINLPKGYQTNTLDQFRLADGLEKNDQPLTIHQLRHTFGSESAGQMVTMILRDLMGHKSLRTTQAVRPGQCGVSKEGVKGVRSSAPWTLSFACRPRDTKICIMRPRYTPTFGNQRFKPVTVYLLG